MGRDEEVDEDASDTRCLVECHSGELDWEDWAEEREAWAETDASEDHEAYA